MFFSPADLILNNDGSVYHLHLRPEHIAQNIITVGDPDRVAMVSNFFDSIEFKTQKREFITHTGFYKNKRLTVISTGIGTDNIEIVIYFPDIKNSILLNVACANEGRVSYKIRDFETERLKNILAESYETALQLYKEQH